MLSVPAQEFAALPNAAAAGPSPSDASILTRRDARTITLAIPAPRGVIVDRNGEPFAQNRVAWQLALQYQQFENADRDFVIRWGRERLEKAKAIHPGVWDFTDDQLWEHYRHRRWLPLYITTHLDQTRKAQIEPKLSGGLILQPVYQRYYPEGDLAAHIIGYTGSVGKLPTGPINYNEPLWEESEGRDGFELLFNAELTGQAGMKKLLFDETGRKFPEEQVKRPRPGGTLVTTLNLKWQKQAEKSLKQHVRSGAFVLIDVYTGEVLVMASRPTFDLNHFIPGISEKDLMAMEADPMTPLFARAFKSSYQPGSAFKPIVAIAALDGGDVTEDTLIDCPGSITLGNHTFHNHNKRAAGAINVKTALATSNNIWFGKVGMRLGATNFLGVARRFGFGEKTGLPLVGEASGLVPTNEYMQRVHRRSFKDGDAVNHSIGQGDLRTSPLQVAQAMAGIANGGVLPKLHLIHQVQDPYGRVVRQAVPERRKWLGVDEHALEVVREGMRQVVTGGTGRSAALSFTELCGKTGTAQWTNTRNLAWFAGFLPYDQPRYAFAAVYEGRPGEKPSGGRNATPIVKSFFEPLKDEFKEILAPAPKAVEIVDETDGEPASSEGDQEEDGIMKAIPVEPLELAPAPDDEDAPEIPRALPVEEFEEEGLPPADELPDD